MWPLVAWNFPLKIAAKPLQMETWLLSTTYRKSPVSYPMVPSPIPCDLPFSHNTSVTNGRTTCRAKDAVQHSYSVWKNNNDIVWTYTAGATSMQSSKSSLSSSSAAAAAAIWRIKIATGESRQIFRLRLRWPVTNSLLSLASPGDNKRSCNDDCWLINRIYFINDLVSCCPHVHWCVKAIYTHSSFIILPDIVRRHRATLLSPSISFNKPQKTINNAPRFSAFMQSPR